MMRTAFLIAVLACLAQLSSAKNYFLSDSSTSVQPVKIVSCKKQSLLVTDQQVYIIKNNSLQSIITSPGRIHDAIITGERILLATDKGLQQYDAQGKLLEDTKAFKNVEVKCLAKDEQQRLWVGCSYKGCFVQIAKDSFEIRLNIPAILSINYSPDSNVWVGTNVGLYRIDTRDFSTTRYAEEGYSGYELPDNLVEQLYSDAASNVWVIMPDYISFKRGKNYEGEIPSYDFIGAKNNNVLSIVPLKDFSYFFITGLGCYYLPNSVLSKETHGMEEIHGQTTNTQAYSLNPAQLSCPKELANEKIVYAGKLSDKIYFVTAKGGWIVPEKQIHKQLRQKANAS